MADYQIARDGEVLGGFSEGDIRQKESTGELRPTDHILKSKGGEPAWALLFTHSPKNDFFQMLEWKDCRKAVLEEQKKATKYLHELIAIAGNTEEKQEQKEIKKRIDEYQDLLIYLAGLLAREKERRHEEEEALKSEEREEEISVYCTTLTEALGFSEDACCQVERHQTWITGSMRGTKHLTSYEDFLADKYWAQRFQDYWPAITESQKKEMWIAFKFLHPSPEDIVTLSVTLTAAPEEHHPALILSFLNNSNYLSKICMSGEEERDAEEDAKVIMEMVSFFDDKHAEQIVDDLNKLVALAKDPSCDEADFTDSLRDFSRQAVGWDEGAVFRQAFSKARKGGRAVKNAAKEIAKETRVYTTDDFIDLDFSIYKKILLKNFFKADELD